MRADRLLSILLTLQTQGQATAKQLAEQLEVSERTIYRDIDALSIAGVPIYADKGPGGGYKLLSSYRTGLNMLTDAEAYALMASVSFEPLAAIGLDKPLKDALLKLMATFKPTEQDFTRIHLDTTDWFTQQEALPYLEIVKHAAWKQQQLIISYQELDGSITEGQLIEPYGLVAKMSSWHIIAKASDELRVYRIAQIKFAQLLPVYFEIPTDFFLPVVWRSLCEGRRDACPS